MKARVVNSSMVASLTAVVVVLWVTLLSVPKTSAIPAFSRKYQTSCTTCHNNYPELNDFGEAFKKNGFKFPKDDEVFVKEPPVLLGSKAQKEAFPGAVYPGEIPGYLPIAFRYEGNFTLNRKQPPGVITQNGFTPRTDLFAPNTFTIISAGSFGQNLSFWIDDDISVGAANANGFMGDGWLKYRDLGHGIGLPKNALNVRFGQFELDLPFTQAKSIYLSPFDIYSETAVGIGGPCITGATVCQTANNATIFGSPQRGIEFGGTPNNGNFDWAVAITNGSNVGAATRSTKDVYVRLSQKFNLERDPESRNAIQAAGPTGPRDHTSIRVGFLYYYGKNQQNQDGVLFPDLATVEEPFYRVGGDLRFKYRKLELFGLVIADKKFETPKDHVVMDQRKMAFIPHVVAVQQGTTVEFLNSDPVGHNVYWPSVSGNKKLSHNLGTWPKGEKKPFQFNDLGTASLLCNVHPEMSGYVVVVPTPYFAVTDKDGNFEIKNIPAGKYTLKTWSEDGKPTTQAVDLSGATATVDLTVKK